MRNAKNMTFGKITSEEKKQIIKQVQKESNKI